MPSAIYNNSLNFKCAKNNTQRHAQNHVYSDQVISIDLESDLWFCITLYICPRNSNKVGDVGPQFLITQFENINFLFLFF